MKSRQAICRAGVGQVLWSLRIKCNNSGAIHWRYSVHHFRLFTPEGLKMVARGWSAAQTPGGISNMDPHPEGMREHPELRHIDLSHPFRMRCSFWIVPGVCAALQPLATIFNPFGVKGDNSIPELLRFCGIGRNQLLHYFFKDHKPTAKLNRR
jgi:hypothetical protein